MAFLGLSTQAKASGLKAIPSGCFTVDRNGMVISSTLPQHYGPELLAQAGRLVIDTFQGAHEAQLIFYEIQIFFSAMKLTARELRGGAIVFVAPYHPT